MSLDKTAFVLETLSETALTPGTITMAGTLMGMESIDLSSEELATESIVDAAKQKMSAALESIGTFFSNAINGVKKLVGMAPSAADLSRIKGAVSVDEKHSPHRIRNILLFMAAGIAALAGTFALIRTGKIPGTAGLNKWMDEAFINQMKRAWPALKDVRDWDGLKHFWRTLVGRENFKDKAVGVVRTVKNTEVGAKVTEVAGKVTDAAGAAASKVSGAAEAVWTKPEVAKVAATVQKLPQSIATVAESAKSAGASLMESALPGSTAAVGDAAAQAAAAGKSAIGGIAAKVQLLNSARRQSSFVIGNVVRGGVSEAVGAMRSVMSKIGNVGRAV